LGIGIRYQCRDNSAAPLNIAKKNLMRTSVAIKTKTVSHKEIVKGMRALRRRVKPGKLSIREMIKEGRRF
jgi:hypothetical protein